MRQLLPAMFAAFALAAGCAGPVALRADAKSIPVVHESDKPLHCKVIAEIAGRGRGKDQAAANQNAMNEFRNSAADHKATHALIESETGGPVGTTDSMQAFVGGKALQCTDGAGADPFAEAPADAGAAEAQAPTPSE